MASSMTEDVRFIKEDLLPEMVFDRCFCDAGSREFVEFKTATVDPNPTKIRAPNGEVVCLTYLAQVEVEFSSVPKSFSVVVKLVPESVVNSDKFGFFLAEEYFYTKMSKKYGTDLFAKCYLSNLGKYGRPVVVLENILDSGYSNATKNLNKEQVELCFRTIARFHATGLRLYNDESEIFREFKNNVFQIHLNSDEKETYDTFILRKLREQDSKFDTTLSPTDSLREFHLQNESSFHTICHGNWSYPNMFFKDVEMKIVNFESMIVSSIGFHLETFVLDLKKTESYFDTSTCLKSYLHELNQTFPEITYNDITEDMNIARPFALIHHFTKTL